MDILVTLSLFFIGFFFLIKGASILVNAARFLAKYFRLSPWFIGMVIVGIGTSIPEFSINIAAAFKETSIGIGTIIGSNTFNILVILGLSALVAPITFRRVWVARDLPINLAAIVVTALFIVFAIFGPSDYPGVTRMEGLVLALLFLAWMIGMFYTKDSSEDDADEKVFTLFTAFIMIVVGIAGVFFGGKWVVDGAAAIAGAFGVSPELIALTIIGAGTSLPELTVSIVSLLKRSPSIAVGNVIGSNIFDFLGIVGIAALIHPIPVLQDVQFDIFAAIGAALLLFLLVMIGRPYTLGRLKGLILVLAYILYLVVVFSRG